MDRYRFAISAENAPLRDCVETKYLGDLYRGTSSDVPQRVYKHQGFSPVRSVQGLSPHFFWVVTARLKSCPDTKPSRVRPHMVFVILIGPDV